MKQNKEKKIASLKNFMDASVKPVFEKLITDILIAMPSDVISWSI
jgi:hypothetical protein